MTPLSYQWRYCSVVLSNVLTHCGRVTQKWILAIICPDNGLSPDGRQGIIWTNISLLLTGNLDQITSIFMQKNKVKNVIYKMAPFFLGLNVYLYDWIPIPGKIIFILKYRRGWFSTLLTPWVCVSLRNIAAFHWYHIHGLVQDCRISTANVVKILQSFTKPLICSGGYKP